MRKFAVSRFQAPIAVLSVLSLALLAGCEGTGAPSAFYFQYKEYLEKPHYRAFALTEVGAEESVMAGWTWRQNSVETAIERALKGCAGADISVLGLRAGPCNLHAIGNIDVSGMNEKQLKKAIELYQNNPDATNADLIPVKK